MAPDDKKHYFAMNLFKQMVKTSQDDVIFSPLSITVALGMLLAGAKGECAKELESALGLNVEDIQVFWKSLVAKSGKNKGSEPGVSLNVANKIFADTGFQMFKTYVERLNVSFSADGENVDFAKNAEACRLAINQWVEEATCGMIKNLLGPTTVTQDTVIVLVNAVYFKGFWREVFVLDATYDDDFYLESGEKIEVSMMHRKCNHKVYIDTATGAETLLLPYKNTDISMVVILPPKDVKVGDFVANSLTSSIVARILLNLNSSVPDDYTVMIPKFKLESQASMTEILKKLDVNGIFGSKADLSGITASKNVCVSDVIHKARIEVDEEGTRAAAATAVTMMAYCARISPPPQEFNVNRPFIFFIADQNAILFSGLIRRPVWEN